MSFETDMLILHHSCYPCIYSILCFTTFWENDQPFIPCHLLRIKFTVPLHGRIKCTWPSQAACNNNSDFFLRIFNILGRWLLSFTLTSSIVSTCSSVNLCKSALKFLVVYLEGANSKYCSISRSYEERDITRHS